MFKSATSRFLLRCSLYGVGAVVIALQAALPGITTDEIVEAVLAGYVAASTYAGIGAVLPQVEPFVGIKKADPDKEVKPNDLD
jgi:hypothetical protein